MSELERALSNPYMNVERIVWLFDDSIYLTGALWKTF